MSIFQELAECEKNDVAVALCSIVFTNGSTPRHPGSKMLVYPDRKTSGTIGGGEFEQKVITEAIESIKLKTPRLIHYEYSSATAANISGGVVVYIEPVFPKIKIIVVGGGHVGQRVVFLARWLDYRVLVSDERQEFCNPNMIPGADDYLCCKLQELPEKIRVDSNTFFVLATKDSTIDTEGLPAILATKAAYIGVIGSKRRWEATRDSLIANGITTEQLSRVRSPIGLVMRAETPQEIAVSIMSEIIMIVNSISHKEMTQN